MKKILLATTLLSMSAGYAAADITWAGSATAGIAQNGTDHCAAADCADPNTYGKGDDTFLSYSSAKLAVTLAGQTDGGLTFGATFDLTAGPTYALADDDGFDNNGGAFGTAAVFISGSFGKITFSTDNLDGFDGDEVTLDTSTPAPGDFTDLDGVYDVQYDGTFGPVAVGIEADLDSGLMAAKANYTVGSLALYAEYSQQDGGNEDIYNVSATYTMGLIAITAATDDQSAASLKVAYAGSNGISASATYNTNTGNDDASFDVTAGYTANGLSVSAEVDNVTSASIGNFDDTPHWTVTASYDLGGGLTIEAGANYTSDVMVGATMSF